MDIAALAQAVVVNFAGVFGFTSFEAPLVVISTAVLSLAATLVLFRWAKASFFG